MKPAVKPVATCHCGRTLVPLWRYDDLICPAGCRDDGPTMAMTALDRWFIGGLTPASLGDLHVIQARTTWFNVFKVNSELLAKWYSPLVEWVSGSQPDPMGYDTVLLSGAVQAALHRWTGPAVVRYVQFVP